MLIKLSKIKLVVFVSTHCTAVSGHKGIKGMLLSESSTCAISQGSHLCNAQLNKYRGNVSSYLAQLV
jgi:hypothetical protein